MENGTSFEEQKMSNEQFVIYCPALNEYMGPFPLEEDAENFAEKNGGCDSKKHRIIRISSAPFSTSIEILKLEGAA